MPRACLAFDRPGLARALADRGIDSVVSPQAAALLIGGCTVDTIIPALATIREQWPLPVLLVVEGDEDALIAAIDAGADDAAPAIATNRLIAARAAALIRRGAPRLLTLGELVIDLVERRVWRSGQRIDLLPREYRLLVELAQRPGETVGRASLLERVCGIGFDPGTNVLDVHVSRLRAKLDRGFAAPLLMTDKGVGYRLVAPDPGAGPNPAADEMAIEAASAAG